MPLSTLEYLQTLQNTTCKKWYEHKPEPVIECDGLAILWDFPVHTYRTIEANRPDIIVKDHEERKCYMIDMTIPMDKNISLKEFEKLSQDIKTCRLKLQKCCN